MPNGVKDVRVAAPVQDVWSFLRDINRWAPLIPGYIEHEVVSDQEFTWKFRADLGMMQRNIVMQVDLKEWLENEKVSFDLNGLNESLEGSGYFELTEESADATRLTGYLDIAGKGMMGSVMNSMMKNYVPQTVGELTEAVAMKI